MAGLNGAEDGGPGLHACWASILLTEGLVPAPDYSLSQ